MRQTSTVRDAGLARQLGVLGQVQRFAMGRNEDFRPHPADHIEQLGAPRMPGDVDEVGSIGDDLDALRHQAVDYAGHRLLVAGDGAGGKDHAVAAARRSEEYGHMSTEKQDHEANLFAMCLLMPEKLVRAEVARMGGVDLCDDEPLKRLPISSALPFR